MKWAIFYEDSKVPPMENFTDGAHIFVFSTSVGYSQRIIPLEDEGWEVRDCLKIFNGKEDRQVALLRKPFKGTIASNVLKNGCGGLNINECRIKTNETRIGNPELSDCEQTAYGTGWQKSGTTPKEGRWPANLILTHTADCEYLGLKEVKGDGHAPKLSKGNPFGGVNEQPHDEHYFKHETVGDYLCQPNCPIRVMDSQSGISKSTGGRTTNISKTSTIYGGGKGLGQDLSPESVKGNPGKGDKGGASRFFFTADSRNQVVAYLRRMINPN